MSRKNKKVYPEQGRRVFIAMSGGVDSSVAAFLLQKEGYNTTGVFMHCFNLDGCAERDAEDARRVAEHLGIPFYIFDFEEDYKREVVNYMIEGYRKGETPNPDVMCNKEIKFGLFLKKALEMGADYIATGHYVRITRSPNISIRGVSEGGNPSAGRQASKPYPSQEQQASLYAARDTNKDQSYFLWTLTQDQLKHCLFPIGDFFKNEVREIARKAGLPTAEKKDSQGICFLGKVKLADFLKRYIPESPGMVFTTEGKAVGEHDGAHFYTIGQRHGLDLRNKNYELGIRGRHETAPVYIAEKNINTNTVVVAEGADNSALYRKEIKIRNVNFINGSLDFRNQYLRLLARVRYRQPLTEAILTFFNSRELKSKQVANCQLLFTETVKFVASGQSAVLYSEEGRLIGGGIITD